MARDKRRKAPRVIDIRKIKILPEKMPQLFRLLIVWVPPSDCESSATGPRKP
jgi:hypothetical protein